MGHLLERTQHRDLYGPTMAIRGVSFDVPQGQIVTILGANGAGKTTILKTVCGIMDAQKGTVSFEGREDPGHGPRSVWSGSASALCPKVASCFRF